MRTEAEGARPVGMHPALGAGYGKDLGGTNPKDLQGAKKCDVSLLPAIATYHAAHAFVDGAMKYGPYNWRDNKVLARVYIAGIKRHVERWEAGEELATDSGVHNLGGVMACAALLLDAQTTGNLVDNRAKSPAVLAAMDKIDAACKAQCEPPKARTAGPTKAEAVDARLATDPCGFALGVRPDFVLMCSCGANVRYQQDRPDQCRGAKKDTAPQLTNPHGGVGACTRPAPHECGVIGSCNGWART